MKVNNANHLKINSNKKLGNEEKKTKEPTFLKRKIIQKRTILFLKPTEAID